MRIEAVVASLKTTNNLIRDKIWTQDLPNTKQWVKTATLL
jgi:hypothetical protein